MQITADLMSSGFLLYQLNLSEYMSAHAEIFEKNTIYFMQWLNNVIHGGPNA